MDVDSSDLLTLVSVQRFVDTRKHQKTIKKEFNRSSLRVSLYICIQTFSYLNTLWSQLVQRSGILLQTDGITSVSYKIMVSKRWPDDVGIESNMK